MVVVVVLFVLLGGGGNLFGNKGNAATQADIQRGFDYSNEMSQMCCCETNRNIDAMRTEGYRNTCSIVEAIKEDGEKTRAMFSAYQMAELKAKLEERDRQLMEANILNSQTAQTVDLVQRLRPAPVPAFIVPAPTGTAPTTPTT